MRDKDGYEVTSLCSEALTTPALKSSQQARSRRRLSRLKRLRELLGPRFHSGIVLYDGDNVLPFGEGLLAVPLSSLWAHGPRASAAAGESS